MKFYITVLTLLYLATSIAAESSGNSEYAFGGGYTFFNDQTSKNIKPDSGFLLRIQNGNGQASIFSFISNLEFIMAGKNHGDFLDKNKNEINETYFDLYMINYSLGVRISPYPDAPVLPYIGFSGALSIATLQFKNKTSSNFSPQQRGLMYGYDIFAGIDFFFVGNKDNGWGLRLEGNMMSLFAMQEFDCGRPQIQTLNATLMIVTAF